MPKELRLLCVHGLGDHRESPWKRDWEAAIRARFPLENEITLTFDFLTYDDIFEGIEISPSEAASAVWKLTRSGATSLLGRRRGILGDVSHWLKWYAGYVVAWVEREDFQEKTRARVLEAIQKVKPDILLAHSLGSLITYNAITHPQATKKGIPELLKNLTYVTLGAQIGNPFVVRNLTPGRIEPLEVKWWYHLFNAEDDVFTAPIQLPGSNNFLQVDTFFDIDGWQDHSAVGYLSHDATRAQVWDPLTLQATTRRRFTPLLAAKAKKRRNPVQRALLVGINEYPDSANRLEGCANDVFQMSSVLQECGFSADEIRVCLDQRATTNGILERLQWLLEDPQPMDQLVFYYSGHGAQLPTYGEGDQVDRMDETLVPHDFDWTPDHCITDDKIFSLYSQLPYETRLLLIFDCCHSGGIHRAGGPKIRGIDPPDDIRHRALRWDMKREMWVDRKLDAINPEFSNDPEAVQKYFGSAGNTARLGRASALRGLTQQSYRKRKKMGKEPVGPYLPIIIEACREDEYSFEYRHGVTSYGAFTYSLSTVLRRKKKITFSDLVEATGKQLQELQYDQAPQILGPEKQVKSLVPWGKG